MSDEDDYVEEEVEFDEETVHLMNRLVDEEWFRDESDFVSYSIQSMEIDSIETFEADPTLDQRIKEIRQIQKGVDNEQIQDFLLDTSYLMQRYARLAHEAGREEDLSKIDGYMADDFIYMVGVPNLSGQDVDEFLDNTLELSSDFWNLSDTANAGYEGIIEDYEQRYFDDSDMKHLLMDQ